MLETENRQFKCGQRIYVIDCIWEDNKPKIVVSDAEVMHIEKNIFRACLRDYSFQEYNVKDYGRLIFDTEVEAEKAAKEFPKRKTILYKINDNYTISKSRIEDIWYGYCDGCIDINFRLKNGEPVNARRIGKDVFLSRKEAKRTAKILRCR